MTAATTTDPRPDGRAPLSRWRAMAGRALSAVAVSGLSSIGNLLLTVTVARREPVAGLGQFAIAFSCYVLGTGLARAAVTDGVLALVPGVGAVRAAAGRVVAVALVVATPAAVLGVLTGSPYLLVIAVTLPGLVVYDYTRALSLGLGRPRLACFQEILWTAASGLAAVLGIAGVIGPVGVFAGWAGSAALLGAGIGYLRGYRLRPAWRQGREQTRLALSFAGQYLVTSGSAQLVTTALAVVAGTAVVGALSAGRTALGPVTLVMATASALTLPYLARTAGASRAVRRRAAGRLTVAMTACALAPTLAVLLVPDRLGTRLLGASWAAARPVMPALAVESLFAVAATVGFAGHRVARAGTRALALGTGLSALRVGMVLAAGAVSGARGAAYAMAAVAAVSAVAWWRSYARVLRRPAPEREPVAQPLTWAAPLVRAGRRPQRAPGRRSLSAPRRSAPDRSAG
ncbi:MAG TPA: hypothetical protein VHA75_07860 [Rugosimonospora sp.]|nr:hypothetical protein [Rugosimonospora sp.]